MLIEGNAKIAAIGLGYVGFTLAFAAAMLTPVVWPPYHGI